MNALMWGFTAIGSSSHLGVGADQLLKLFIFIFSQEKKVGNDAVIIDVVNNALSMKVSAKHAKYSAYQKEILLSKKCG